MKDLLADVRLTEKAKGLSQPKAKSFIQYCDKGSIGDLRQRETDFLTNRPRLAAELSGLTKPATIVATRAFFEKEMPKPSRLSRAVSFIARRLPWKS